MFIINNRDVKGIIKNGAGFFKRNSMILEVADSFIWIPIKLHVPSIGTFIGLFKGIQTLYLHKLTPLPSHEFSCYLKRPAFRKHPRLPFIRLKKMTQVKMGGVGCERVICRHADVPVIALILYLHLHSLALRQGITIMDGQCLLARLFPF